MISIPSDIWTVIAEHSGPEGSFLRLVCKAAAAIPRSKSPDYYIRAHYSRDGFLDWAGRLHTDPEISSRQWIFESIVSFCLRYGEGAIVLSLVRAGFVLPGSVLAIVASMGHQGLRWSEPEFIDLLLRENLRFSFWRDDGAESRKTYEVPDRDDNTIYLLEFARYLCTSIHGYQCPQHVQDASRRYASVARHLVAYVIPSVDAYRLGRSLDYDKIFAHTSVSCEDDLDDLIRGLIDGIGDTDYETNPDTRASVNQFWRNFRYHIDNDTSSYLSEWAEEYIRGIIGPRYDGSD